jgi:pyruvate oxidase
LDDQTPYNANKIRINALLTRKMAAMANGLRNRSGTVFFLKIRIAAKLKARIVKRNSSSAFSTHNTSDCWELYPYQIYSQRMIAMPLTETKPVNQILNPRKNQPATHYTVSQYIIEQLSLWGIKRIYGVIGDANLHFLDALSRQTKIQYIACKHECAAALMASAEAKLTGRIGVCLATSGPGMANLLNGLGDAAADHAPVLAITGQVESSKMTPETKQFIDQQRLMSGITDETYLLAHPDALPDLLKTAMVKSFVMGKVAHLSIPKDMYVRQVKGEPPLALQEHLFQPVRGPLEQIEQTAEMLRNAKKPVLYIGIGVKNVAAEVKTLAEIVNAAVITTMPARALFPNDHELYAGGLGQAGSEASSVLLGESDFILTLGATWWPDQYVPVQAPVWQIDRSPINISKGSLPVKGIVDDLTQCVPQLVNLLQGMGPNYPGSKTWKDRIAEVAGEWKRQISLEANQEGTPIPPQRVIRSVAEHAAKDAILTLDTGDHTIWFNRIFQAKGRQDILISGKWRTIGFGLPAAIAAQLEFPRRQVVSVVGDGGFQQTMQEFQTAVELGLSITVVILNNQSYAIEKNRMVLSGMNTLGSKLRNPDFSLFAQACGGIGMKAAAGPQLDQILSEALQSKKPVIVDVDTADTAVPHTVI